MTSSGDRAHSRLGWLGTKVLSGGLNPGRGSALLEVVAGSVVQEVHLDEAEHNLGEAGKADVEQSAGILLNRML